MARSRFSGAEPAANNGGQTLRRILIGMVLLCLLSPILAADNIGDWNGKDRTSTYINWYGDPPTQFGQSYPMVVLDPFLSTSIWASDSAASESTGTWNISRWLGQTGILQWSIADTAVVPGYRTQLYAVKVRVRNSPNETWYTVKNDTITDSVGIQFRDTLNFADPMFRAPYMSLMFTGLEGNRMKAKAAKLTATVKLERTDLAAPPSASATATATCPE
jgi:hypothetical protein